MLFPVLSLGGQAVGGFQDVADDAWYAGAVAFVSDRGIMNGMAEDTFAPNRDLTRAMMVQILYNLEDRPGGDGAPFPDIPEDAWYAEAVAWAADAGIVNGFGDGTFGPKKPITREQMTAILYRYTGLYKGREATPSGDLSGFADADRVSAYAAEALQWATAAGYIQGMGDGTLAPKGTATRAQVATLFMNYLDEPSSATPSDLEEAGE